MTTDLQRHGSFWAVFGLYCVTTFAQSFSLFWWPPLFCEDGLFFTHFYNDRASSPFSWFYNGYVAIGPNLLGYVATFFPPRIVPYWFTTAALLAGAFAYSLFTLPRFRIVVPSDRSRTVIAALLVLWPLGDFALAHSGVYSLWHLLLALSLLALAPVGRAGWREALLIAVQLFAVCSHPMSVALIPVWVASAVFRDRTVFARACRLGLTVAAILFYVLAVRHRAYDPFGWDVIERTAYLLPVRGVLEAWIGPPMVARLHGRGSEWLNPALGGVLFALPAGLTILVRKRLRRSGLLFCWLVLGLVVAMVWIPVTTRSLAGRPDLWGSRYYYVPQYLYLLVWMILSERLILARGWSQLQVAALLVPVGIWCAALLYLNRYAWWEKVPTDGPRVAKLLARVAEAERGVRSEKRLSFKRGKWSLVFQVRRPQR